MIFYTYTYQGIVAISEILASIEQAIGWLIVAVGAGIDVISMKTLRGAKTMRFCKYCGTEISETDELCPNCGRNLKSASTNETTQENSTINHIETVTKSIREHPKFLFGIVALIVCVLIVVIAVNPGNANIADVKQSCFRQRLLLFT